MLTSDVLRNPVQAQSECGRLSTKNRQDSDKVVALDKELASLKARFAAVSTDYDAAVKVGGEAARTQPHVPMVAGSFAHILLSGLHLTCCVGTALHQGHHRLTHLADAAYSTDNSQRKKE